MRGSGSRREGKPVTSDAFVESEPIAAPYGKFLIYTSDRTGGQHLFRMDADGANVKQLTFDSGIDTAPDVSRDGKWIVYSSNANNQNRIWKLAIGGGSSIQLTYHESVAPSFSPDGTQVACNYPGDSPAIHRASMSFHLKRALLSNPSRF